MFTVKEKAFIEVMVLLYAAVIAATVIIPVRSSEVKLATNPSGDEIYSKAHEPFNITCQTIGDDSHKFSSIRWLNKEGFLIPEGTPGVQKVGQNSLKLILTDPKIEESGVYKCEAVYNKTDLLETPVKIIFYGNETDTPSILNAEVKNVTSNSVEFFLTITGSIKSIEVKYTEKLNKTEYRLEWNYGDNYEVKGLVPSGLYSFQFRTVPSKDEVWSKVYQVILLPDVPELIFLRLEGLKVQFKWFIKSDDDLRGTIDHLEVKYFWVSQEIGRNGWESSTCVLTIQIPRCQAHRSYTIHDLLPQTYYEIQSRSHTASGYGELYKQKIYAYK